jgi:hypothetical protein
MIAGAEHLCVWFRADGAFGCVDSLVVVPVVHMQKFLALRARRVALVKDRQRNGGQKGRWILREIRARHNHSGLALCTPTHR